MTSKPKFSLVLCTLGNFTDIKKFIFSLTQYDKNFIELIVVDQNRFPISHFFDEIRSLGVDVKYFHVNFKGLSRARNFGLDYAIGDYIAFPDDDCCYSNDLLLNVAARFKHEMDFLSVNTSDENDSTKSLVRLPQVKGDITYKERKAVSFTLFFTKRAINLTGLFDENMGVGAGTKYGAGEESDYIVRALYLGLKGVYFHDLYVFHPAKESTGIFNEELKKRMISYGGGYGYFLRKNFFILGFFNALKSVLGVLWRVVKNISSQFEFKMAICFLFGFINGFLKR
ncbi:glycosyltransferase family 2 protein [Yersinia kristensenii]|uniref:glycosyltransferase family 2 protein n=1 Tax=Yersinia kristensenii TaxID=28152 RepID=UPI0011A20C20|nr:glycosyltransferase family 2 protein [Yersinia kristensenii]